MPPTPSARYAVHVEEGGSHGDLFELEQTTYYRVIDLRTGQVVLTFTGEMSASMSRGSGQWDDYQYGGARAVTLAPDERSVHVSYYGGQEEDVPLPP